MTRQYHDEGPPKGEIVVVVAPPGAAPPVTEEELDAAVDVISAVDAGVLQSLNQRIKQRNKT